MKHSLILIALLAAMLPSWAGTPVDDAAFSISTTNVEVRELTPSLIRLKSEHNSYVIKLQPHAAGNVVFSLSDINYSSTVRIPDLAFEVRITGYHGERKVYPAFSLDSANDEVETNGNAMRFRRIKGSIPVWFTESVDSINLEYSNSHGINVHQYFMIEDLKIVDAIPTVENPVFIPCQQTEILVAMDGSSSVVKRDRRAVGKQMLRFMRKMEDTLEHSRLQIIEFGTEIISSVHSSERDALVDALVQYKRGKNASGWTNWSVAFDEALKQKPDLFIFITDGWSNWVDGKPGSFTAAYARLVEKCNAIKANGTRMLFITAEMHTFNSQSSILGNFLSGEHTREVTEATLTDDIDLAATDLISLDNFSSIDMIPIGSFLSCPEVEQEEVKVPEDSIVSAGDE